MKRKIAVFILGLCALLLESFAVSPPVSPIAGKSRMLHLEELPYLAPEVRTHEFTSYKRIAELGDYDSWLFERNGERVMFSAEGPGCVTRLWVTGVSDMNSLLKFYFDGETTASFSVTPQELFRSGRWPSPLVAGPDQSAGGRICYIPIPFQQSLVIADAGDSKIHYYNITYERYAADTMIESWTATEEYTNVSAYLSQAGQDPKPDAGNVLHSISSSVSAGHDLVLLDKSGSGVVQSIELDLSPATVEILNHCTIRMVFDGQTTVQEMPVGEFFGSAVGEVEYTSLPMGMRTNGNWYCYFPMPYWASAKIILHNGASANISNLAANVEVNSVGYDSEKAGYFCARRQSRTFGNSDGDMVLFDESETAGKFVGVSLYMEGDHVGNGGMMYLEGDARVYIDGAEAPAVHGTGNEDWFNGAFYYNDYADQGANQSEELFSMPYHGLPAKHHYDPPHNWTQAYRFNLADPIEFSSSMLFTMEAGGYPYFTTGFYSAVGYSYQRLTPLSCLETLFYPEGESDLFSYSCDGVVSTNTARFITPYAEISASDETMVGFSNVSLSSFTVEIPPSNRGVILQSLSDFSAGTNSAAITANGREAGRWSHTDLNFTNSAFGWGINELLMPLSITEGTNRLTISIAYSAPATEYRFRIIPLVARSVGDSLFSEWVSHYALFGDEADALADPDGDGWLNLVEYFGGGSPIDASDLGYPLRLDIDLSGGSNICSVVFARRQDVQQRGLSSFVERTSDLVSGNWTPVSPVSENTEAFGENFEWVTTQVNEGSNAIGFFRVRVQLQ